MHPLRATAAFAFGQARLWPEVRLGGFRQNSFVRPYRKDQAKLINLLDAAPPCLLV
jgi:hypothetical protein